MSSTDRNTSHLDAQSRVYGPETWTVYDLLDRSLGPAGPEMMEELAADWLEEGSRILDVGCGEGGHLVRLLQGTPGTFGTGADPVERLVETAMRRAGEADLSGRMEVVVAALPRLPFNDQHFDFVWCRDVLEIVEPLEAAVAEIGRVLKPDGHALIYTVFATDLLEPEEAGMLRRHLSARLENLDERRVEAAFTDADLEIVQKRVIGTEWREYAEERTRPASQALLRLARLRRQRDKIIEAAGRDIFEHIEANLHWLVWQFLGKLESTLYLLTK